MLAKLRRIKISTRLIFVGLVILTLFTLTISIGIINADAIYKKFFILLEDRYKKIELIDSIDDHASKIAEQFIEILLIKDISKLESVFNNIHAERNVILQKISDLEAITRTKHGLELLNTVRNSYDKCPDIEQSLIQAIKENRIDSEKELLFSNVKQHHLKCESDLNQLKVI